MAKKVTDLDDIAEQINDLGTLIAGRIDASEAKLTLRMDKLDGRMDGLDGRMGRLENRMSGLEHEVSDLRSWIERIDSRLMGVESDIKEVYDQIVALEKKSIAHLKTITNLSTGWLKLLSGLRKCLVKPAYPCRNFRR